MNWQLLGLLRNPGLSAAISVIGYKAQKPLSVAEGDTEIGVHHYSQLLLLILCTTLQQGPSHANGSRLWRKTQQHKKFATAHTFQSDSAMVGDRSETTFSFESNLRFFLIPGRISDPIFDLFSNWKASPHSSNWVKCQFYYCIPEPLAQLLLLGGFHFKSHAFNPSLYRSNSLHATSQLYSENSILSLSGEERNKSQSKIQ